MATLLMGVATAMAYTTKPCETTYPACDMTKEGAQCGQSTIWFEDIGQLALYYCGGNTPGRCGGPNSGGTCSELLYRLGMASKVWCGDTLLGYCFTSMGGTPDSTGYDCGYQPCPDVPNRIVPNIIGYPAPSPWVQWVPFPLPSGDGPGF